MYVKRSVFLGIVVSVLSFSHAQAQSGAENAAKFNQLVLDSRVAFSQAGMQFGDKLVATAKFGKADDILQLKSKYVDGLILESKTREDWQAIPRSNSKSENELHVAFKEFLEFQRDFLQKDSVLMIRHVLDSKLSADEKIRKCAAIVDRVAKTELEVSARMEKARKAFAEENKLKAKLPK